MTLLNSNEKSKTSPLKLFLGIFFSACIFGVIAGISFNIVARKSIKELRNSRSDLTQMTSLLNTIGDKTGFLINSEVVDENGDDTSDDNVDDNADLDAGNDNISADVKNDISDTDSNIINANATGIDVSDIAKDCMPSIVAINVKSIESVDYGFWGGTYQYEQEGSGSGIIIEKKKDELIIVTNNHVVSNASTVSVTFVDGKSYEAQVKSVDSDYDLAVVVVKLSSISTDTLSTIKMAKIGSSDDLEVGEQVVAIGNALGYGQSVTTGIVSAKERTTGTNKLPLLQTDAAINPGNSGGALLNMRGELVGINSSKYASTDVEGVGYAIPVSEISDILSGLINRKTRVKLSDAERGYLGISCQTIDESTANQYGIPEGVLVSDTNINSAAKRCGIEKGCIITKFDGQSVHSSDELIELLGYYAVGEKVNVIVMVPKGDKYVETSISVTLGTK